MTSRSDSPNCSNCGADVSGEYCATCGQRVDVDARSLRRWARDVLEETLALDGRLLQTLRALVLRPGHLTLEWRRGRHARWIHPFRLYLLASVFYFALIALVPEDPGSISVDQAAEVDAAWQAQIAADTEAAGAAAPRALFLAVPLFAGLLKLLFRRAGWFYTEHLVNGLHVHAFFFFVLGISWLLEPLPDPWDYWLQAPFLLWMIAYVLLALHRCYGGHTVWLALKAVPLLFIYPVFVIFLSIFTGDITGGPEDDLAAVHESYWDFHTLREQANTARERQLAVAQQVLVGYRRVEARLVTPHVRVHMADLLMFLNQPAGAKIQAELALVEDADDPLALGLFGVAAEAVGDSSAAHGAAQLLREARGTGATVTGDRHQPDIDRLLLWADTRSPGGR